MLEINWSVFYYEPILLRGGSSTGDELQFVLENSRLTVKAVIDLILSALF